MLSPPMYLDDLYKFLCNFSYNFWSGLKVYTFDVSALLYRIWEADIQKCMLIDKPGMND
jgi:hypothetical protein